MGGPRSRDLQVFEPSGAFEQLAFIACFAVSASENTRRAYWADTRHWLAFCRRRGVSPAEPPQHAVIAWVEEMKRTGGRDGGSTAPKTRARRVAALSSVYARLVRDEKIRANPFSVEQGPKRERPLAIAPTPVASPEAVRAVLATCDQTFTGIRDAAIIRLLWATGVRRASLTSMTFERMRREPVGFSALLIAKRNKEVQVWIQGRAAQALEEWFKALRQLGIHRGPIWRKDSGVVLNEKDVWRMLRKRSRDCGVEPLTPHTFRVAFLTFNPADLAAKQAAAGHADPSTTMGYDRNSARGRSAFEAMPELEDM